MMSKPFIFTALLVLSTTFMVSCDNNEKVDVTGQAIQLTNYLITTSDDGSLGRLSKNASTGILINDQEGSTLYGNIRATADGRGNFTFAEEMLWPSSSAPLYIYAYGPYQSGWTDNLSGWNTFTVVTDQSSDADYRASDLLHGLPSGSNPVSPTDDEVPLLFSHVLTLVSVSATDETGEVDLSSGVVRLLGVSPTVMFCPVSGAIASVASGGVDITLYNITSSSSSLSCRGVIAPQGIASGQAFIELEVGGETYTMALTETMNLEGGNRYTLNITIGPDGISLVTTVADWNNSDDGETAIDISGMTVAADDDTQVGLDLYLCLGGSNMAGQADIPANLTAAMTDIYLLTDTGEMELATNPLNRYATPTADSTLLGLSPAYTFAQAMHDQTGRRIGLIVNAVGESTIASWLPGSSQGYYETTLDRLQQALEYGTLCGIIWHQGEPDYADPDGYQESLLTLATAYRDEFDLPDLPFVAGQLGQWSWTGTSEGPQDFNDMIASILTFISYADYASTDELEPDDDDDSQPCFDAESQLILGQRYAQAMLQLQGVSQ